ncbi:hypothetical protein FRX31_030765 [Thalictrum thalictroides]|uniref:Uncharacterized protein n=1 Tax=Thalictrum thalictroides TaxID=46969 RepID=A0A7J6V3L1_THATH|nr:hypothetical protein FRX31_030765 [Thalictrum thalictroides]
MGLTKTGTSFRCVKPLGSIIGILRTNKGGMFAQITMHNKRAAKKFSTLCIPRGDKANGWDSFGSQIYKLLLKGLSFLKAPERNSRPPVSQDTIPQSSLLSDSLRMGRQSEGHHPEVVTIDARGGITNYSWWTSFVICRSNCTIPD